jgi:hypothetical protein
MENIMVGYVHPGVTHGHFPMMLMNAGLDLKNPIVGCAATSYPSNAKARNQLIQTFLDTPADWLLWIDDDATFDSDAPAKLLRRAQQAGAKMAHAYSFGYNPETGVVYPGAWDFMNGNWEPVVLKHEEIWVDGVGCHFGLVHRSVYESFGPPWHIDHLEHPDTGKLMGHDLAFCLQAQQSGNGRVLYTHHVKTGHLKDWNVAWDDYLRQQE